MNTIINYKVCEKCYISKSNDEFDRDFRCKGNYKKICKLCNNKPLKSHKTIVKHTLYQRKKCNKQYKINNKCNRIQQNDNNYINEKNNEMSNARNELIQFLLECQQNMDKINNLYDLLMFHTQFQTNKNRLKNASNVLEK